jgi:hypothetical protein
MQEQMRTGVGACVSGALLACAGSAAGGPVELEFLLFEIDYGVFADGGGSPPPMQGPMTIGEGDDELSWTQIDGVASAMAAAATSLSVSGSDLGLHLAGSLVTSAEVVVGDDDKFLFEHAQAEVYLNQLLISITVNEESVVTALEMPVVLEGVGTIDVGGMQVLAPGTYDFEYAGGFATGALAWGGANESAFDTNAWSFGLDVAVVPSPGCVVAAGCLFWCARRRR